MKILIAGANGMLGSDLARSFESHHEVRAVGRDTLDVADSNAWTRHLDEFLPEVVINAAAMTDVDACENYPSKAFDVNATGCQNLAKAVAYSSALVVYFSTDYVFDGAKGAPYHEEDSPNPLNVYGKSKQLGEEWIRDNCPRHLIIRTSWAFGYGGKNFVRTILSAARQGNTLRVVNDQRGSPSYTYDVAQHTLRMFERGCTGTYHLTNQGSSTWYELACGALEFSGLSNPRVVPVSTADYTRPARRPANSVLANARLEQEGFTPMRSWRSAVQQYVESIRYEEAAAGLRR